LVKEMAKKDKGNLVEALGAQRILSYVCLDQIYVILKFN
jgi:hypothetical protein